MANIITSLRIVFSIVLLFLPVLSPEFYTVYLICGISDILDGKLARKTNSATKFGAKFDSIADFIFVISCSIKLFPVISFPTWIWIWIASIGALKIINYSYVFLKHHKLTIFHTILNKITGLSLFIFAIAINFFSILLVVVPICILATIASIQEVHYIFNNKTIEIL